MTARTHDNRTVAEAARHRYRTKGPTGFLKPVHQWAVLVAGIRVFSTRIKREALRHYHRCCRYSKEDAGRTSGKMIELYKDGKISMRFIP